jgi:hypothetical protein
MNTTNAQGRETWSLTFREEHVLKVFENRVLRRIFGPKRDEIVGGRRKLHYEEHHILHSLSNIVIITKEYEMGRACSTHGEEGKEEEKIMHIWF